MPSQWDNFQLWRKDATVDTQAIVDDEILGAQGKLDFWLYVWYPPSEILSGSGHETDLSYIEDVLEAHIASAHKTKVKFALLIPYQMIQWGSGTHFDDFVDWIAEKTTDAAYFKVINNRPLIALYNDSFSGGWAGNVDDWTTLKNAIIAAGGGTPWGVSVNSVTMFGNLSLQGNMRYEYNGVPLSGNGRHSYAELITADASGDGALPGGQPVSSRTVIMDRRPFASPESATVWTDLPTQPQWVSTLQSGMVSTQKFVIIAAWDEVAEVGPGILPTVQEGTRFLDGLGWVRSLPKPSTFTYEIDATSLYQTTTGSWSEVFPDPDGVQGAHDTDEVSSSNTGDSKAFSHARMTGCGLYASKGPDRGIADIEVDDVDVADVDLYAASPVVHQLVWTSGALSDATHKCEAIVKGTKNASSSSVKVQIDSWQVTYKP